MRVLALLILAFSLSITGCGTFDSLVIQATDRSPSPLQPLYSGVRFDVGMVAMALDPDRRQLCGLLGPVFTGCFLALDAPVSVAADTVMLPVTIPWTIYCLATPNYQKLANEMTWDWKDERAAAEFSAKNLPDGYGVDIVDRHELTNTTLHFTKDGKDCLSVEGHVSTVFLIHDDVLYYADYSPIASGCTIVARNLTNGEVLWRMPFSELDSRNYSEYSNKVTLDMFQGILRVFGHESAGDYVELLNPTTGKLLGLKLFRVSRRKSVELTTLIDKPPQPAAPTSLWLSPPHPSLEKPDLSAPAEVTQSRTK